MSDIELTPENETVIRSMVMSRTREISRATGASLKEAHAMACEEIGSVLKPPASGKDVAKLLTSRMSERAAQIRASGVRLGGRKKTKSLPLEQMDVPVSDLIQVVDAGPVQSADDTPVLEVEDVSDQDNPFNESEEDMLVRVLTYELAGMRVGSVRKVTFFDASYASKADSDAIMSRVAKRLRWSVKTGKPYDTKRSRNTLFVKRLA